MKAILTFHDISDTGHVLSYPEKKFRQLISALRSNNVKICSLDELMNTDAQHAVALTFDDGILSVYESALPVLKAADVQAHIYVVTSQVGKDNCWASQPTTAEKLKLMSWDQLSACQEAGMMIENHTVNHPDLRGLTSSQIEEECEEASNQIEHRLGRRPEHFAYPYGYSNDRARLHIAKYYKTAVTTKLQYLDSKNLNAALPRLDSYYLQKWGIHRHIFSAASRTYLASRNALRIFRGH